MSAFQRNNFQPVWRCVEKDMAVLILVVGSSRKSGNLSISLILFYFVLFLVSPSCTWRTKLDSTYLHNGQQLYTYWQQRLKKIQQSGKVQNQYFNKVEKSLSYACYFHHNFWLENWIALILVALESSWKIQQISLK